MPIIPFDLVPFADSLQDLLEEINVDEDVIRRTVAFLLKSADALDDLAFDGVQPAAFGASWSGESMEHHTALAHAYFVESLAEMVKTLTGTGDNVKNYHRDIVITDDEVKRGSHQLLKQHDLDSTEDDA